jgi:calcineurin-like phosphoesterase family protein
MVNIIAFYFLRTSLWGFENQNSKYLLSNSNFDLTNPDQIFSIVSHIGADLPYDDPSIIDCIKNYIIGEKSDILFVLGDVGKNIKVKLVQVRNTLPFRIEMIPGNSDISNDQGKNNFIAEWENYRSIQKDNVLYLLLNSMDCDSNYYPHEGCSMTESQVNFIYNILDNINDKIDHVFIMVHHIYWWKELDIISRLKLSKYTELTFAHIFTSFNRYKAEIFKTDDKSFSLNPEIKSSLVSLLKKLLFMGNHVVFGRNDANSSTEWFSNIHHILKNMDQNVFVIGGDAPFNGNTMIDGIHYINTGFENYYWNINGKEMFTIKIKGKHFQIESINLKY